MPVRDRQVEFQGHHTSQAYYKSGIISPEYEGIQFERKSVTGKDTTGHPKRGALTVPAR